LKSEREREEREKLRAQNREKRLKSLQQQRREHRSPTILTPPTLPTDGEAEKSIWSISNMRQAIREGNMFYQRREALQEHYTAQFQNILHERMNPPKRYNSPRLSNKIVVGENPAKENTDNKEGDKDTKEPRNRRHSVTPKLAMETTKAKKHQSAESPGKQEKKIKITSHHSAERPTHVEKEPASNSRAIKFQTHTDVISTTTANTTTAKRTESLVRFNDAGGSDSGEGSASGTSGEASSNEEEVSESEDSHVKKVYPRPIKKKEGKKKGLFGIFKKR